MKKLLLLITLLFTIPVFSQINESWNTLNLSGKFKDESTIVCEAEQRYNITNNYVRYFHFDMGYIKKFNNHISVGLFYRELYEVKSGVRVSERRPHVDLFYKYNSNFSTRVRAEYQFKEIAEDIWRVRIRPMYQSSLMKNFNPYISSEIFLYKEGIQRNRFNIGLTIKYKNYEVQPGYMLESINKSGTWSQNNIIWINNKIKF